MGVWEPQSYLALRNPRPDAGTSAGTNSTQPHGLPAAVTPLDPGGPDRYRGKAKPWESDTPDRGVADG